ncbi:MAG TPA: Rrf2 family transcriptional regulator [Ignavibacteriaceae bacterium]|nr:Rrf2 family transcriptional regulator [Ignavibacteriaceae bacterium]
MSASTKLSTAVKALSYIALSSPVPKNSNEISEHIGTNASKLRKILSMLVKNDIVESTQGASGGFLIKKDIEELHLQEIYCAIEDRKAFYLNVSDCNGEQNEITKLNTFFLDLFSDIQVEIENKMMKITLADILNKINKNKSNN